MRYKYEVISTLSKKMFQNLLETYKVNETSHLQNQNKNWKDFYA